ncbi:cytochrome b [Mesorhizobium sp. 1B3]|uniref:cytochrome b n=1 Tax=Mesorhizobium sp. 1B3 TaxID=3243599 RepID=UPI003D9676D5
MMRNSRQAYGLVAIVLHWLIALLILGQLVFGTIMVRIADQRLAFELIQWHKSFGFLTLALVCVRLAWRLASPLPVYPATLPDWEIRSARAVHRLFYVLMLALPLSGWALVSVSVLAIPTLAFDLVVIPHLPLGISETSENLWAAGHRLLGYAMMGLVSIHVAAALRHEFWLRNRLLWRMLAPGSRIREERSRNFADR